jgi:hypothetical protein
MTARSRRTWLLTAVLVLAACGAPAAPSTMAPGLSTTATATAAAPSASASSVRDAGWQASIRELVGIREQTHPDPWHGIDRPTYVAAIEAAAARIPTLNDDQALVELVRLAAMPGWAGRDGHTGIFPFIPGSGTHEYPVRWWRFSDGLVITATTAPYQDLVGSRVTAINGHPIDDVVARVEPLAPRDNPSNLRAYGLIYLRVSELLAGLGVIERAGPATFSLVDRDGRPVERSIEPQTAEDDVVWNSGFPHRLPARKVDWLSGQDRTIWWKELPASRTILIEFNEVNTGSATTAEEVLARVRRGGIDRVIVDLRNNVGGDNRTYADFLAALGDPAIDRPGRLMALIGRVTFSAAANFATELEATTDVTFLGEASGGSPNLYGDAFKRVLPGGHQALYVASRYWVKSTPNDPRLAIEPDVAVPYSSADYFDDRDPVLEAALARP